MFHTSHISSLSLPKIVFLDVLIIGLAYMIPALSHILPLPLYYLDPMRLFVLFGYFISRSQKNGYVLAVTIPLFSMWATGHPVFVKSLLILMELSVNIYLFQILSRFFSINIFWKIWISIIFSKFIYYLLKYICLQLTWIDGTLISTPVVVQLLTITFVSTVIFLFSKTKLFSFGK
jgi:hypothetical protein